MRLIDADALMKEYAEFVKESNNSDFADVPTWNDAVSLLGSAPTVKAIPIELYEQIKGERDVAIEQLKALNIELFEKPYLKAIPIEWIKKWCNEEHNRKSLEERLLKRYGVITMLEDWEKENEID